MSLYLTRRDMRRLTARTQRATQRRVLEQKGYRYDLDGDGWPLVLVADVEARYRGEPQGRRSRPNFDALEAG